MFQERKGGRGAAGEQQSPPGPVDRTGGRNGAGGGALRSCRQRGVRRGWSEGKAWQAAGGFRAQPGQEAQDVRLCPHRDRDSGGLGGLCQHRPKAEVV